MFAVLGITGQTGSATAGALLSVGERVRGVVRDTAGAVTWRNRGVELVRGDAEDADSLTRAFEGAAGAYVLVPPQPRHPDPLAVYERVAAAVGSAARRAGLPRLVFLSSEGAHLPEGTGAILGLHRAETALDAGSARVSFLRAAYFQENWRAVFGAVAAEGMLPTMLADFEARRPMVATADIGVAAARLLRAEHAPALVELAGPEDYSVLAVADVAAVVFGRAVTPIQPPRKAWVDVLIDTGMERPYAALIADMYDAINAGRVRFSGTVPLDRGTTSLARTLRSWEPAQA